jgi:hypothetical protein
MGPRTGAKGKTILTFCAWATQRRRLQEPIVCVECSSHFDVTVLDRALGDLYLVNSDKVDVQSLGWPGRRNRFWAPMIHKATIGTVIASWSNVVPLFGRVLKATWRCFIVATLEERLDELEWSTARRKSMSYGKDIAHFRKWLSEDPDSFWERAFRESLTDVEAERLAYYEESEGGDKVYMLNQNALPPACRGVSSSSSILHTVISNAGIQFVSETNCWLTPTELLIANGIPTSVQLGGGIRASSFCPGGPSRSTDRKRQCVQHQAGNTMNTMLCGVFWSYVLGWVPTTEIAR